MSILTVVGAGLGDVAPGVAVVASLGGLGLRLGHTRDGGGPSHILQQQLCSYST